MTCPPLDILLYAHDGRGLGHASRSIGIAMALRRLYPGLRLLVVTGCEQCRELIDSSLLDWLKLPSYQTRVIKGKSRGINGKSNFTDQELGELRSKALKQVVELYRPRLVLADHAPQGKHKELLSAIATAKDTKWVLGVRGVTGSVKQVQSPLAASVYRDHYHGLLWYGDSEVLGRQHKDQLAKQFASKVTETGYVSRLLELQYLQPTPPTDNSNIQTPISGTISLPWFGESGSRTATCVAQALKRLEKVTGPWHIYLGEQDRWGGTGADHQHFTNLEHCRVRPFGQQYAVSLLRSKVALIYGGYNSLVDILAVGIPAVVLLRKMKDNEQHMHLQHLAGINDRLVTIDEDKLTADKLVNLLTDRLKKDRPANLSLNLDGAASTAHYLAALLQSEPVSGHDK